MFLNKFKYTTLQAIDSVSKDFTELVFQHTACSVNTNFRCFQNAAERPRCFIIAQQWIMFLNNFKYTISQAIDSVSKDFTELFFLTIF